MSVARIPRGKAWAAAISAVLVTLTLPTVTATPAAATTTAYDSTYYKNAIGKTGTSLKSSLHTIISSQSKIDLLLAERVDDVLPADEGEQRGRGVGSVRWDVAGDGRQRRAHDLCER